MSLDTNEKNDPEVEPKVTTASMPVPAPVPQPQPQGDPDPLPRETGSEKAGETCPTCGGDVPVVETKYGSLVRGACPVCSEDQLEAQKAAAGR